MNTLIPGAPLRSLSPTTNEYQRAQGESRAAKPARAARFTLDAPEHSGTIPGARGDILTPGVALTSNLAVIFTLNQHNFMVEHTSATTSWRIIASARAVQQRRLTPSHTKKKNGQRLRYYVPGASSSTVAKRTSSRLATARRGYPESS